MELWMFAVAIIAVCVTVFGSILQAGTWFWKQVQRLVEQKTAQVEKKSEAFFIRNEKMFEQINQNLDRHEEAIANLVEGESCQNRRLDQHDKQFEKLFKRFDKKLTKTLDNLEEASR